MHKSSFNLKSIFSTSSFQLLIFISGLVINKCIAVYSGPAGIALFGVIKNFHVFFGSILKLGSDNVIINRASKASKSNAQKKELISSILKLCIFQIMFVFFALIIMDGLIYDLVFQSIMPSEEKWLVRLILILIFLTVFSEMIVSFFNGLLDLKKVFISGFSGSFLTMLLALSIQPTSFFEISILALSSGSFSAIILLYFLFQNSYIFSSDVDGFYKTSQTTLPISLPLLIQPILVSTAFLVIQNLISSSYGMKELSFFVLCTTLVGVIMSLMMASGRMYFLPKLGSLTDLDERNRFFQTNIYFFLIAASIVCFIIFFFAPLIIQILYSDKFLEASLLLSLLSSTVILKSFEWIIAISSWEKSRYRIYIIPEFIREVLYVASCFICIWLQFEFVYIFIGFLFSEIIASTFWIGYLYFYKSELSINPFTIATVYIITFLLIVLNYHAI
ncbi:hypothetical protein N9L56_00175 [Gammaproteobacteria bacterium]|nr:hypothetical protein [Gammaproteobacteria bacterium]